MTDANDDIMLIRRYRRGDIQALDTLVKRYRYQLFGYIIKMTGSSQDADEIFQDTWLKAIKKIGLYRNRNLLGWLVRIAHNNIVARSRRNRHELSLDAENQHGVSLGETIEDESRGPTADIENRDLAAAIEKAVQQLPQKQREVFILRTRADLTFKEIAKIQRTSINTVLARMQYALSKLREPLKGEYDEL